MREGVGVLSLPPPRPPLPLEVIESSFFVPPPRANFFDTYCGSPGWTMELIGFDPLRQELLFPLDELEGAARGAARPRRLLMAGQ